MEQRQKSRIIAALLAVFLGQFGAHKFYLGEPGGVRRIVLTCTIIGAVVTWIWAWVDGMKLMTMESTEFAQRYN